MKITMKNMISVVAVAALTLAFGLAYAVDDQIPDFNANKDTGTVLYQAFLKHDADFGKGSAAGGVRSEGTIRSEEYTSDEMPKFPGAIPKDAKHEAVVEKGSAAGGVRAKEVDRSDEYTSDTIPTLSQKR